jgi:hypothetical protein
MRIIYAYENMVRFEVYRSCLKFTLPIFTYNVPVILHYPPFPANKSYDIINGKGEMPLRFSSAEELVLRSLKIQETPEPQNPTIKNYH